MEKNSTKMFQDVFNTSMAKAARIRGLNTAWAEVLHLATRVRFKKRTIIPHHEDGGMYYLSKGIVIITYSSSCGHDRIALYIEPGSLFNEARSLTGYEPGGRFCCAQDVELYRFPTNILTEDFIRTYPHLIYNLLQSMGGKMLIHYSFLADMGTGSHLAHVARLIVSLSKRYNNANIFPSRITQQEVANLLGIHRATLARILVQLKDMGAIQHFTAREVHISDYALLEKAACQ